MADVPLEELQGKTPLEAADTPNMDFIAKNGQAGLIKTVPDGFLPGSDVANMGILGYDPGIYYTGRGPIEAVSLNVDIPKHKIAFRCNLVHIDNNRMNDFSAGHISSEESSILIQELNDYFEGRGINFYSGVSYRHIALLDEEYLDLECVPPHDITGKDIESFLPKGSRQREIQSLMLECSKVLENSKINSRRIQSGKVPANNVWLWGQGKRPSFKKFRDLFSIEGGIVTAVDLLKGLAKLSGLEAPDIKEATGFIDTNYENKIKAAFDILDRKDFVYIHVEAPDEAGHMGRVDYKIKAIEDFDKKVVGPVLEYQKNGKDVKVMVLPDHPTPCTTRTHTSEPVPFAIYYQGIERDKVMSYTERAVTDGHADVEYSWELLPYFLGC
ncbi:MAG: cofactor-independent phosphoglycerate mutase [bacterium]|nr:cofactor-independent phosphoglycerate mutase [bacterium]